MVEMAGGPFPGLHRVKARRGLRQSAIATRRLCRPEVGVPSRLRDSCARWRTDRAQKQWSREGVHISVSVRRGQQNPASVRGPGGRSPTGAATSVQRGAKRLLSLLGRWIEPAYRRNDLFEPRLGAHGTVGPGSDQDREHGSRVRAQVGRGGEGDGQCPPDVDPVKLKSTHTEGALMAHQLAAVLTRIGMQCLDEAVMAVLVNANQPSRPRRNQQPRWNRSGRWIRHEQSDLRQPYYRNPGETLQGGARFQTGSEVATSPRDQLVAVQMTRLSPESDTGRFGGHSQGGLGAGAGPCEHTESRCHPGAPTWLSAADRRSAFPGLPVVTAKGGLRRPRRGAPLCRPEVGVPWPACRESEGGLHRPRRSAPLCRPEVGVPWPACRQSERGLRRRGAARRCADRRSAFPGLPVVKARGGLRRPRRGAPRCRPEVEVPWPARDQAGSRFL